MTDPHIRIVWQFESKCQHAEIRCAGCQRTVILPPGLAIRTLGAASTLVSLERRLRCRQCGARGATIRGVYREYHG